jgi:outer membrane protein assembly factor BamA
MLKLRPGDVFRVANIRETLKVINSAYVERGYNFTPIPDTRIDDSTGIITVDIYCDEGSVSRLPNER